MIHLTINGREVDVEVLRRVSAERTAVVHPTGLVGTSIKLCYQFEMRRGLLGTSWAKLLGWTRPAALPPAIRIEDAVEFRVGVRGEGFDMEAAEPCKLWPHDLVNDTNIRDYAINIETEAQVDLFIAPGLARNPDAAQTILGDAARELLGCARPKE